MANDPETHDEQTAPAARGRTDLAAGDEPYQPELKQVRAGPVILIMIALCLLMSALTLGLLLFI